MTIIARWKVWIFYTSKGSKMGSGGKKKGNNAVLGENSVNGMNTVVVEENNDDDYDWDVDDSDDGGHILDNGDTVLGGCGGGGGGGGQHVIGSGGDFITAPKVSQLFGESLLVWLMTQYRTLHEPSRIQIIEIGPGKGMLSCDIVRSAISTFPDFAMALTTNSGQRQLIIINQIVITQQTEFDDNNY